MHPSSEIEREYAVRVLGDVSPETLERLRSGVELEDGEAHFDRLVDAGGEGANHWYHVTLREGRNREVRRLWESQGIAVSRLTRVRYGTVVLPRSVRAGRFTDLKGPELYALLALVGLHAEAPARKGGRRAAPRPGRARTAPAERGPRSRSEQTPAGRAGGSRAERSGERTRREDPPAERRRRNRGEANTASRAPQGEGTPARRSKAGEARSRKPGRLSLAPETPRTARDEGAPRKSRMVPRPRSRRPR